jgi:hypothetical protein
MANYHVVKNRDRGGWDAKRENSSRASGNYSTQQQAEAAAKGYSSRSGGGEVRIHSVKGPIRDSDTVSPGRDPFPPRDKRN